MLELFLWCTTLVRQGKNDLLIRIFILNKQESHSWGGEAELMNLLYKLAE
jgi:hypothetical protein